MSQSIVRQLIFKDIYLMRRYVLAYWVAGLLCVAFMVLVSGEIAGAVGTILIVVAMASAGIHAIFLTIIEEKVKLNLPFIMSLPVTSAQYGVAKITANLLIFGSVWLTLSIAGSFVLIGGDGLPRGALPLLTIMTTAIFAAYTLMLSTALISGNQSATIASTVIANLGVQGYIWWVQSLYPIRAFVGGDTAVWNTTTVTVLVAQLAFIVALIIITVQIQIRKKDFI